MGFKKVVISESLGTVSKRYGHGISPNDTLQAERASEKYHNDVKWLKILDDFQGSPKLIDCDDDNLTVTTEYVGEILENSTIPNDWYHQCTLLIDGLKKFKCCHNDIHRKNMTVRDGKLYLVDFELATEATGEESHRKNEITIIFHVLAAYNGFDSKLCKRFYEHYMASKLML